MEDDPSCRASNHFHNPYKQWDRAGLTDLQWLIGWWCWISSPYDPDEISSSLVWATGLLNSSGTEVASDVIVRNEWDWSSAREYFYTYLTGKNYQGFQVATDVVQRNEYLIKTLRALGQVMHLLQDAAVPAHVRDDFTQGHLMINPELGNPMKWIGNGFEKYVERNDDGEWFDVAPVKVNLNTPPWRISDFWDTDQLYLPSESDPPANMSILGLAEYASMNFFSEYRIFHSDFPYPKPEHCAVVLSSPPVNTQDPLDRQYLASVNGHPGEQVDHLAVVSYSKYFIEAHLPHVSSELVPLYMDENCYYEYAQHLIPRAIGYSSQLLDYFFRGTLEIRHPFIKLKANNGEVAIGGFEFEVKNTSASEDLISGDLDLVYQYLSADGESVFGVVNNENIILKSTEQPFYINTGEAANVINTSYVRLSADLDPDAYIPLDADDLSIMLVYSGPLGAETDIAIAVGSHRFDEASLASNTRWLFDHQLISG